ncbi:MAG: FAD-dependent oxidoreductase [Myxococcota bacterium]
MRVVIIGNGVAGMEAALTVRNRQPDWDVTVVSEESDNFFSRTALMWVFCGQMSHRDIEPLERDVYENARLERVRSRAVGVDAKAKEVLLAGGKRLGYDRLIIACGSRPRPGPWKNSGLRGIGHFVTMQDLEWFEAEVHGQRPNHRPPNADAHLDRTTDDSPYKPREVAAQKRGTLAKHPVVIGGGLIGIEAIEIAVAAKLRPRFLIREEWFWPMAIERRESTWITERMRHHGVDVNLEENVEQFIDDGSGNVSKVRTDQGEYDADAVVIAIGVMPNTEWLKDSEVELDSRGGIVVDAHQQTNVEGVYAAGDCAAVRWFDGALRPEQLWYTSRDQGRIAARSALGDDARYQRGYWYNSAKLMDIEYTTAGLVNMNVEGEKNWFYEETGAVRSTTRITLAPGPDGDRVVGFNLLGRRWDHEVLIQWIAERRSLHYVLKHLRRASFDTEFVPSLQIPKAAWKTPLEGPAPSKIDPPAAYPYR